MSEAVPIILTALALVLVALLVWKAPILTDEDIKWIKGEDTHPKDKK